MDNSQLAPFLESIVKAYCSKYISTWLQTATNDEIKGLKVVQAIIKHKGQKRFKVHEKQERFDIDQAKNDVRRRTMTSFYTSHYSSASPSHSHISEILKYKKLSELPYSQILTPTALQLIENWVKLDDDAKFKDLLLTFLQGVNSVCKINGNLPVTSNQDTFQWFSKEEKERMNFPVTVRNTKVQFFDRKKSHSLVSEQKDLIPLKTFYEPKFYQDRMVRKMRGSGDFINWVYDQNGSIYQHSFASRTNKIPTEKAVPANSSTVIRVLPKASIIINNMNGPGLADFILRTQVLNLYRKMIKSVYRVPNQSIRVETISFFKSQFLLISTKTDLTAMKHSVSGLTEMIHRSGAGKNKL